MNEPNATDMDEFRRTIAKDPARRADARQSLITFDEKFQQRALETERELVEAILTVSDNDPQRAANELDALARAFVFVRDCRNQFDQGLGFAIDIAVEVLTDRKEADA